MGIKLCLVFEITTFFVLFCNNRVLNWSLQVQFDNFDFIFIVNSMDLKYKQLYCFLKRQSFLTNWDTTKKSQVKSFFQVVSKTQGLTVGLNRYTPVIQYSRMKLNNFHQRYFKI